MTPGNGLTAARDGLHLYEDGILFHGPALQGIRSVLSRGADELLVQCRIPRPGAGLPGYGGRRYRAVPTDLALQTALVLAAESGTVGWLPLGVDRLELWEPLPDTESFTIRAWKAGDDSHRLRVNAEAYSAAGILLQRLTGIVLVTSPGLDEKFRTAVRGWKPSEVRKGSHVSA
ncbi:polyketide synthase dehydratase domain-containing protein [Frankia sp. AgB32]|uniref:polyketide synthase dehydratase domain-containing protein n=1 Tax=Frankia sp. AgB32 TaxID=631119 RepID=UPI0034D42C38